MTTATGAKKILWVDDEIELLRPHFLFLQQRGYHVHAISSGADALALIEAESYDLVLLDEQMPGRSGLEVLEILRRDGPHPRVVMITKSEEDKTMTEAIGRRVDEYLVKPTSLRQVLSLVTRILEGSSVRQQQVARDFAELYKELMDGHVQLGAAREPGPISSVDSLLEDLRRDFGGWIRRVYPDWMRGGSDAPPSPLTW